METSSTSTDRRGFLSVVIASVQTAIGGTLAYILGGAVLAPVFSRKSENWLPAGNVADLADDEPMPVMMRVSRQDGYAQVVDRQVLYLLKAGDGSVRALSSTCTHLGCRVSWDPDEKVLKCPCHGGTYDRTGAVVSGPPPAPLASMPTKIDGDMVLVQI